MSNIGFATLSVIPSLKGMEGAISSQLGGPLAAASTKAGGQSATALGGGFTSKIGGALKGATLPFIGIGVAAIASAKGVEDAQNTILRTTGASGKAADGLLASFKNVAKGSAASFGTIASTLAEVSQRTGLAGKPLESLTSQIVTFNRITKDAPIGVKDLTQTLAGFKVPAGQSGVVLDKLFTISQKTGVPLADLNSTLGASGAILRQFNLPIEQAASVMAKLDKAGVPASAAMGGLKKAFTTFAKAGEDPKTALIGVLGQIDKLVKAGDTKGAQQLGSKIFGARGVGLVDAAIQGKLAIGDLTKVVPNLGKGIKATAASTSTMSAKLGVLKNNAQLALAQLGGPLLDIANTGLKTLVPLIQKLATGFGGLPGPVKTALVGMVALGAVAGPITRLASSVVKFGKGIFTIGKGLVNAATSTASFAKNVAVSTFNIVKNTAAFVAQKLAAFAAAAAQKAMTAAQWLLNAAMDANPIGLIVVGIAALAAGFVLAYQHITPFRNAVDALGRAFVVAFGWVRDHWPLLLGILTGPIGIAVLIIKANWERITGFAQAAFGWVQRNWPLLLGILTGPIGLAAVVISKNWDRIKAGVASVFGAVKGTFDRVVAFLLGVPGRIVGAFIGLEKQLFNVGVNIVEGLLNGIKHGWDDLTSWIGDAASHLPSFIKGPLGIKSPSKVFHEIGGQLMEGLRLGIKDATPGVQKQLGLMAGAVKKTPLELGKLRLPTHADLVAGANFGKFVTTDPNAVSKLFNKGAPPDVIRAAFTAQQHPVVRRPHIASTISAASLASAQPAASVQIIVHGNVYGDSHLRKIVDAEVVPVLQRVTAKKGYVPQVITSASS